MAKQRLKTRIEQYRQSLSIHGGVVNLCAVSLGLRLARLPIPSQRLRLYVYRTIYGKKYPALNEDELEHGLETYPSLNSLFTRGVRQELRPIADSPRQFLCPCDGTVQDIGRITAGKLLTVKGIEYTVESLLTGSDATDFRDGWYGIFFLSPSDCHRIFSPQEGQIEEATHVPGYRLLVHPPYQRKEYPVFTLNERVIFHMQTPLGPCALIMVAGWGVGNITLPWDPSFRPRARAFSRKPYRPAHQVERGEWLATFELGSTALLLTGPAANVSVDVAIGDKVKYGQAVFTLDDE